MPIGYRQSDRDLTVVAWVGRVDATIWREHTRKIGSDPLFPTARVLVDLRDAILDDVGETEASSTAALYSERSHLPVKVAILLRDAGFEIAEVFQRHFYKSVEVLVFGDLLPACEWLGVGSRAVDVLTEVRSELYDVPRQHDETARGQTTEDVWLMIADARAELAEYLATLTAEQWETPSLCAEWRVRDVVGHLVEGMHEISVTDFLMDFVRDGFDFNNTIANNAKRLGQKSPDELLDELRAGIDSRIRPPTMSVDSLLAELVVHTQDIRRALGGPRVIPEARLRVALDRMSRAGPLLGNKERLVGIELRATDLDWTRGSGPEVVGPGEALLMAMCGRKAALVDLTGDGVSLLGSR